MFAQMMQWILGKSGRTKVSKQTSRPQRTLRVEGLESRDTPTVLGDFWYVFTNDPGAGFTAVAQGFTDADAMMANALTFHQIGSLNDYVNGQIEQGGDLYSTANVFAHVGVYTAEAAGAVYLYTFFGGPSAAIGYTTEGGSCANFHMSWGVATENGVVWRGAYGSGDVLVEGLSGTPGYWASITGIPILNSAAVAGAPAVTCAPGSVCVTSALNAVFRGIWHVW